MDRESKIFTNVVKKWARTPLSRAKNSTNKWAEWLGRGEREGDKGAKEFCPGWRHQPGPKAPLLSRLLAPTGIKDPRGLLSRLEPPTGTKGGHFCPGWCLAGATNGDKRGSFCPGWCLQPGQKAPAPLPPRARLAVGPGTKATYCPGLKGCQDKWPGTKACFVVVTDRRVQIKSGDIYIVVHWKRMQCLCASLVTFLNILIQFFLLMKYVLMHIREKKIYWYGHLMHLVYHFEYL